MKSLAQQIHSMKLNWPSFAVSTIGENHLIWFGELTAVQKPYRIAVEYGLSINPTTDPMFRRFPVVRVLEPKLRPNYKASEEGPLPHVYFDTTDLTNSALCLFDPLANEWSTNDFISLTTIPWTCDWLASYESWRATGKWFAGGRHASPLSEIITI
jgi:hypothetical protein